MRLDTVVLLQNISDQGMSKLSIHSSTRTLAPSGRKTSSRTPVAVIAVCSLSTEEAIIMNQHEAALKTVRNLDIFLGTLSLIRPNLTLFYTAPGARYLRKEQFYEQDYFSSPLKEVSIFWRFQDSYFPTIQSDELARNTVDILVQDRSNPTIFSRPD